ncbi:UNVERIFIED_CONTAM: hypothetical protein K2H54_001032 [Gekko kuhli]
MSQPQRYTSTRSFEWQTDLCDCGSDCRICLCGLFCFCCLGCKISKDMEECCCCGPSVAMRTRYRTQYRIPVIGYHNHFIFMFQGVPQATL